MNMQTTSHILMIRPVNFGFNEETADTNAFQQAASKEPEVTTQAKALEEFDHFVVVLQSAGVDVTVIEDTPQPHTPDSIFPNNWVSFHEDGTVCIYPMQAANRRQERRPDIIDALRKRFRIQKQINLSGYEQEEKFLEGTGSMVLDRDHKIAYACHSPRTHTSVLNDFCKQLGYHPFSFHATDENGLAIYHTNVLMCVGDRFAVICLESIPDVNERISVKNKLLETQKEIIEISRYQLVHFAGNMLQLRNQAGEKLIVMSSQAYKSLEPAQVQVLEKYGRLLHVPLHTIEQNGGGSARCMIAEIHLPLK